MGELKRVLAEVGERLQQDAQREFVPESWIELIKWENDPSYKPKLTDDPAPVEAIKKLWGSEDN